MYQPTTHTDKTRPHRDVTVRLADHGDAHALLRLATLDSQPVPQGPVVVAGLNGDLVAAVQVFGGQAIADPFQRTAALVEMLELRAGQLRSEMPDPRPASLRTRLAGLVRDTRPVPYLP